MINYKLVNYLCSCINLIFASNCVHLNVCALKKLLNNNKLESNLCLITLLSHYKQKQSHTKITNGNIMQENNINNKTNNRNGLVIYKPA